MTATEPQLDFVTLMREHQTGVWRFVRALGAEANLADDVTQETFMAVYRKPFEQRSRAETVGYLRTVARNLFLKARRDAGRQVNIEALEQRWVQLVGDGDGQEAAAALKQCLETLEDKPKQALELQYQQGKQRLEIAEALGMTDDGIKTLLARAKARLRKCMEMRLGTLERDA